ncbi:cartilage matrix protein-like [Mercenaria mercenaria]|uniref:cartilage matrix protein-like n=1 Tax=Mercenaria mercenaria TaxID=6596 RepID=UPI00234F5989|nr:cartilage matrix protein-like [Mercenaria mercenaria]
MCLLKTVSGSGNAKKYKMMCGAPLFCSTDRKRNQQYSSVIGLQSRGASVDLHCCDSDLCNSPEKTITTTRPITTTTTTTTTSTPTTRLTVSQTPVYHYATQQPASCQRDIIIMVEDSLEMALYYGVVKSSLAHVISHLDIGPGATRVGLGTFGPHSGTKKWDLDSYMDKASVLSAVNRLSHQNWDSNANNLVAVNFVLQNFYQGNRPGVPDDVIFITEGHTPHWFSQNKLNTAIQSLHQKSNNVIAIALGAANQNELHHISTDNQHYFYVQDILHYDHNNLVSNVLNLVLCK